MAYTVTIAGATKTINDGWVLRESINGRNTLGFEVLSRDGSYSPALFAEVILAEDGTPRFGGHIDRPTRQDTAGHGGSAIVTACSAVDYNAYADRRLVNTVISAGTLKSVLQYLDDFLTQYGVTLDAAQVDGPAIPVMTVGFSRLDEVLNKLSVLSDGYVWEIDYNKSFRMFLPGSTAAPFNVTDGDGTAIGEILVEPSRVDYANSVWVIGGGDVPYVAQDDDGGLAANLVEAVVRYPDVLDAAVLDSLATKELARRQLQPRLVTYTTKRTEFIKPGMTQTLTVPAHSIAAATFLILEIETRGNSQNDVTRTVKLIEGTLAAPDWREVYKNWSGGGTGTGTILTGSGGPPSASPGTVFLGGSRNTGKNPSPAAWVPVVDWVAYTAPSSYNGRVRAQVRASSGTVTVRLYNITDATVAAVGSAVTSTTEVDITSFTVGLTTGKQYRLEMTNSVGGATVWAIGTLEPQ